MYTLFKFQGDPAREAVWPKQWLFEEIFWPNVVTLSRKIFWVFWRIYRRPTVIQRHPLPPLPPLRRQPRETALSTLLAFATFSEIRRKHLIEQWKQHQIQNYFYAGVLTTADNSQSITSLCKHRPLSTKWPQKQRNKHFNAYLYLTSIRRKPQNNKITSLLRSLFS